MYAECANCVSTMMTMIAVWLGWFPETPTIFFIFFLFLVWYSLTLPAASTIIFVYIFFRTRCLLTMGSMSDGENVDFSLLHTETESSSYYMNWRLTLHRRFHNHLRHVFQFFSSLVCWLQIELCTRNLNSILPSSSTARLCCCCACMRPRLNFCTIFLNRPSWAEICCSILKWPDGDAVCTSTQPPRHCLEHIKTRTKQVYLSRKWRFDVVDDDNLISNITWDSCLPIISV